MCDRTDWTDRACTGFSRFLRHPARKRSGSILTTPEPARDDNRPSLWRWSRHRGPGARGQGSTSLKQEACWCFYIHRNWKISRFLVGGGNIHSSSRICINPMKNPLAKVGCTSPPKSTPWRRTCAPITAPRHPQRCVPKRLPCKNQICPRLLLLGNSIETK